VLQRLELTRIELRNFIGDDTSVDHRTYQHVQHTLAHLGMTSTIHAPWRQNIAAEDIDERSTAIDQHRQVVALAGQLGSDVVVFHGGWHVDRLVGQQIALESMSLLIEDANLHGVQLALENEEASRPTLFQHPEDFHLVDIDGLGFVLDVAHAHTFGHTASDFLTVFGDRLVEVHIHDNHGGRDEHLPVGEGTIDWNRTFDALSHADADGIIPVIECKSISNLERCVGALNRLMADVPRR
jgi:sugar phosphate isomerase/epimerase